MGVQGKQDEVIGEILENGFGGIKSKRLLIVSMLLERYKPVIKEFYKYYREATSRDTADHSMQVSDIRQTVLQVD
jgi:hypothetical protein